MRAYDVTRHQPHPPGYPYFVGSGAVLQPLFGDANAALVTVSILLETAAVLAVYRLGALMLSRPAGAAAGLLLVCSVTFWTYGEVALAYAALAAFSAAAALCAYENLFLDRDRALPCALVYAAGTGFRPDLALFLLPLLAAACYRRPARRIAAAAALAAGGVFLWLVPVMLLSGGPNAYLEAFAAYARSDVVDRYAPAARGAAALAVNLRDTLQYLLYALAAETPLVVSGGLLLLLRPLQRPLLLFLLGWMAPMAAFYLLVHIGDPGYVFSMLPALILLGLAGWRAALDGPGRSRLGRIAVPALTAILAANTLVFLAYPRQLMLPGLRAADAAAAAREAFARGYPSDTVLLVSYESYKLLLHDLPGYRHSAWLDTSTPAPQAIPVPAGVTTALFLDPSVVAAAAQLAPVAQVDAGNQRFTAVRVEAGKALQYEDGTISLAP